MSYLNKAMLIGNVGKTPEIKIVNGEKVANFSLATTYKDATEWHNIVAWGKKAEVIEQYVSKGSSLFIEGTIRTRQWEDQSGNKRYTTEILANTIQLLDRKGTAPVSEDDLPE